MTQGASNGNFLSDLFDFSFTRFVTQRIIRVLYVLVVVLAALWALAIFFALASSGGGGVVFGLVVAPIGFLLAVSYTRVLLEVIMVIFRISENTRVTAELLGGSPAATHAPPMEEPPPAAPQDEPPPPATPDEPPA